MRALRRHGCRSVAGLVLLGIVGCQGSSSREHKGRLGDCSERCGRLPQIAKTVAEMRVPASAPPPHGGPLTPGTYVVTEMTAYTGPGGAIGRTGLERAWTMRITTSGSGASFESSYIHLADPCPEYHQTGTLTTSGSTLKASVSCWTDHPIPQDFTEAYTADGDTLLVFGEPSHTIKFIRQP